MATVTPISTKTFPDDWSCADLQRHLGDIPADRIRITPPPGQATEADLLRVNDGKQGLCELIDQVLVEKTMGNFESQLAALIIFSLHDFLRNKKIGFVLGEAGLFRVAPDQMRSPDVSFVAWNRFPKGRSSRQAVYDFAPDLAVEVLSKGNTQAEMDRKLREYFQAGTRLVWYLDPQQRQMRVYSAVDDVQVVEESGVVDGGEVLPGFSMSLAELFARAEQGPPESA